MPGKNVVKIYVENGYYHVYNRGVDKRTIFQDEQDYVVFLHFLKILLSPSLKQAQSQVLYETQKLTGIIPVKEKPIISLANEIKLLAFCLMPNHFHILLQQINQNGLEKFMRRLSIMYVMYFNTKNQRTGRLFQGTYKAVLIDKDPYFLHISRYIHRNPLDLGDIVSSPHNLLQYSYSSYPYYLNQKHADWLDPKPILECFSNVLLEASRSVNSYQKFVEEYECDEKEALGELRLDSNGSKPKKSGQVFWTGIIPVQKYLSRI